MRRKKSLISTFLLEISVSLWIWVFEWKKAFWSDSKRICCFFRRRGHQRHTLQYDWLINSPLPFLSSFQYSAKRQSSNKGTVLFYSGHSELATSICLGKLTGVDLFHLSRRKKTWPSPSCLIFIRTLEYISFSVWVLKRMTAHSECNKAYYQYQLSGIPCYGNLLSSIICKLLRIMREIFWWSM